jgi:crotonobetainyl-CoA:carnitine CoA-transferase CaiB-like acyl-CoA transferase
MVLGDLGADVIKVEGPLGDPVRGLAPPWYRDVATYFLAVNRHRRMVSLDLLEDEDFAKLERLASLADVVIENYLPHQDAVLRTHRLRDAAPNAIWVKVTPTSGSGTEASEPTFDLLAQARSGVMSVTGFADGPPMKVGVPIADVVTGLFAAVSALAGLLARPNGNGVTVHVPLVESMMSALVNQVQGLLVTGVEPTRLGNDHPSIAPYGPVTASDGEVMIAVGTDTQFGSLDRVLGGALLTANPNWESNSERVINRHLVRQAIEDAISKWTVARCVEEFSREGVPCAPILSVAGALGQRFVQESHFIQEVDSVVGPMRMLASPIIWNGVRPDIRFGPGAHGADNDHLGL